MNQQPIRSNPGTWQETPQNQYQPGWNQQQNTGPSRGNWNEQPGQSNQGRVPQQNTGPYNGGNWNEQPVPGSPGWAQGSTAKLHTDLRWQLERATSTRTWCLG